MERRSGTAGDGTLRAPKVLLKKFYRKNTPTLLIRKMKKNPSSRGEKPGRLQGRKDHFRKKKDACKGKKTGGNSLDCSAANATAAEKNPPFESSEKKGKKGDPPNGR